MQLEVQLFDEQPSAPHDDNISEQVEMTVISDCYVGWLAGIGSSVSTHAYICRAICSNNISFQVHHDYMYVMMLQNYENSYGLAPHGQTTLVCAIVPGHALPLTNMFAILINEHINSIDDDMHPKALTTTTSPLHVSQTPTVNRSKPRSRTLRRPKCISPTRACMLQMERHRAVTTSLCSEHPLQVVQPTVAGTPYTSEEIRILTLNDGAS
jgi:hypothetical protein